MRTENHFATAHPIFSRTCSAPKGDFSVQEKYPGTTCPDAGGADANSICQRPAGRRRPAAVFAAAKIGHEKAAAPAAAVRIGGRSPATPGVDGGKVDAPAAALPPPAAGWPASLAEARSCAWRSGGNSRGKRGRPATAGDGSLRQQAAEGAAPVDTAGAAAHRDAEY